MNKSTSDCVFEFAYLVIFSKSLVDSNPSSFFTMISVMSLHVQRGSHERIPNRKHRDTIRFKTNKYQIHTATNDNDNMETKHIWSLLQFPILFRVKSASPRIGMDHHKCRQRSWLKVAHSGHWSSASSRHCSNHPFNLSVAALYNSQRTQCLHSVLSSALYAVYPANCPPNAAMHRMNPISKVSKTMLSTANAPL